MLQISTYDYEQYSLVFHSNETVDTFRNRILDVQWARYQDVYRKERRILRQCKLHLKTVIVKIVKILL